MKFIKENAAKGIRIPPSALDLSGIPFGEKVEMRVLDNAILMLKGRMTAPELLTVVEQLNSTAEELFAHLTMVCGPCDGCDEESCPAESLDEEAIDLPGYLRREAGIPEDVKLCAEVDEETGSVTLSAAGHRYNLQDVPPELLEICEKAGICLGELEEHMIREDVVYGD